MAAVTICGDFGDQMVNTKITLIIFFAAKDGETLYSQQKQDQKLTVAMKLKDTCSLEENLWPT